MNKFTFTEVCKTRMLHPDWTWEKIAESNGVTKQRVSQILIKANLNNIAISDLSPRMNNNINSINTDANCDLKLILKLARRNKIKTIKYLLSFSCQILKSPRFYVAILYSPFIFAVLSVAIFWLLGVLIKATFNSGLHYMANGCWNNPFKELTTPRGKRQ